MDINYTQLQTQHYLRSPKFSNSDCELLFALRSHTLRGIKGNFPSYYTKDLSCPLNCEETKHQDSQIHLLNCVRVLAQLKGDDTGTVLYDDIYGCLDKQLAVVKLFSKLLQIREDLLKMDTSAATPTLGMPGEQWGHIKFPYVKYIITSKCIGYKVSVFS